MLEVTVLILISITILLHVCHACKSMYGKRQTEQPFIRYRGCVVGCLVWLINTISHGSSEPYSF